MDLHGVSYGESSSVVVSNAFTGKFMSFDTPGFKAPQLVCKGKLAISHSAYFIGIEGGLRKIIY